MQFMGQITLKGQNYAKSVYPLLILFQKSLTTSWQFFVTIAV